MLVLRLRLRLCQKSSSVKRQNVSAIVSARCEPPCLPRLCSSVKVLALAIALVLTSLVWSRLYKTSKHLPAVVQFNCDLRPLACANVAYFQIETSLCVFKKQLWRFLSNCLFCYSRCFLCVPSARDPIPMSEFYFFCLLLLFTSFVFMWPWVHVMNKPAQDCHVMRVRSRFVLHHCQYCRSQDDAHKHALTKEKAEWMICSPKRRDRFISSLRI